MVHCAHSRTYRPIRADSTASFRKVPVESNAPLFELQQHYEYASVGLTFSTKNVTDVNRSPVNMDLLT